jgi:hypothetical protein
MREQFRKSGIASLDLEEWKDSFDSESLNRKGLGDTDGNDDANEQT